MEGGKAKHKFGIYLPQMFEAKTYVRMSLLGAHRRSMVRVLGSFSAKHALRHDVCFLVFLQVFLRVLTCPHQKLLPPYQIVPIAESRLRRASERA